MNWIGTYLNGGQPATMPVQADDLAAASAAFMAQIPEGSFVSITVDTSQEDAAKTAAITKLVALGLTEGEARAILGG